MIKVIIADDHQLIREGLKNVLFSEIDFVLVAETDNSYEIINIVQNSEFDVLILDINFPEKSGFEILKEVKLLSPAAKILMLSMHPEERYAIRTLKAGASGYLNKDCDPQELVKAIRTIASGRKYITPSIGERLLSSKDNSLENPVEILSDREFEVLRMIAEGNSQTDIANQLSLGVSTVNTYRSRILEKLELKSNSDIIHFALENKLID